MQIIMAVGTKIQYAFYSMCVCASLSLNTFYRYLLYIRIL